MKDRFLTHRPRKNDGKDSTLNRSNLKKLESEAGGSTAKNTGREGISNMGESVVSSEHPKKLQSKYCPKILANAIDIKLMTIGFVDFLMDDIMVPTYLTHLGT